MTQLADLVVRRPRRRRGRRRSRCPRDLIASLARAPPLNFLTVQVTPFSSAHCLTQRLDGLRRVGRVVGPDDQLGAAAAPPPPADVVAAAEPDADPDPAEAAEEAAELAAVVELVLLPPPHAARSSDTPARAIPAWTLWRMGIPLSWVVGRMVGALIERRSWRREPHGSACELLLASVEMRAMRVSGSARSERLRTLELNRVSKRLLLPRTGVKTRPCFRSQCRSRRSATRNRRGAQFASHTGDLLGGQAIRLEAAVGVYRSADPVQHGPVVGTSIRDREVTRL